MTHVGIILNSKLPVGLIAALMSLSRCTYYILAEKLGPATADGWSSRGHARADGSNAARSPREQPNQIDFVLGLPDYLSG